MPEEIWRQTRKLPIRSGRYLQPGLARANAIVRDAAAASGADFISPLNLLCDAGGCLLSTDSRDRKPLAWDDAHLTDDGSQLIVRLAASRLPCAGGWEAASADRCAQAR